MVGHSVSQEAGQTVTLPLKYIFVIDIKIWNFNAQKKYSRRTLINVLNVTFDKDIAYFSIVLNYFYFHEYDQIRSDHKFNYLEMDNLVVYVILTSEWLNDCSSILFLLDNHINRSMERFQYQGLRIGIQPH